MGFSSVKIAMKSCISFDLHRHIEVKITFFPALVLVLRFPQTTYIHLYARIYLAQHRWLTIAFQLFRDPIFCFIWAELCPIGISRFLISWTLSNASCSDGQLAIFSLHNELGCLTFLSVFFLSFLFFLFTLFFLVWCFCCFFFAQH